MTALGLNSAESISAANELSSTPLFASFLMIIISEIGDKTFLVAALMAMRYDRLLVFIAAFLALLLMSVLSALLGHTIPTFLPVWLTRLIATALFFIFGIKMLLESRNVTSNALEEEMLEVENAIVTGDDVLARNLEDGSHAADRSSTDRMTSTIKGFKNLVSLASNPAFTQTFTMTFLGEWGDRSQIATIAMAADSNPWLVIFGTVLGHSICTAGAVIGGKLLAAKISLQQVTFAGGVLFVLFGFMGLWQCKSAIVFDRT